MKTKTVLAVFLMGAALFLVCSFSGCKGILDPKDPFTIVKINYTLNSMMRQDTITMIDGANVRYRGKVYYPSIGIKYFDTTYRKIYFLDSLLNGISSKTLWNTTGNLPDPFISEPSYYKLLLIREDGEEKIIQFSQKIPEIDSLITQFKRISYQFLP